MASNRRARSPEDKQERQAQILAAALALWGERTLAGFTMAEVAARCGLSKGTLYLYFGTKEELLLALLEGQLIGWLDAIDAGLAADGTWDAERLAALLGDAAAGQPALARLLPLAASLEQNVRLAAFRAHKERLAARLARSAEGLQRRLPALAPGDAVWLLQQAYALLIGLGQLAAPPRHLAQVLSAEALAPLRVELGPALRRAVAAIARGLAAG